MRYNMFEETEEKNYLRTLVLILVIGLLIYIILPWNIIFPKKIICPDGIIENAICVETKIIIQKEYVNVLVTPIPDGKIYFANEYQSGIRKLNRPFSFMHELRNSVGGKTNVKVTFNVYNYLIFNSLHWFSPSDNKYYIELPQLMNSKFLFIMVNIYIDNIIGDSVELELFDRNKFIVEVNNNFYYSKDYPEQMQFKELEYTYNLNDDSIIEAYGQKRIYSKSKEYTSSGGEYSRKQYELISGISNAADGYLIFEIPLNSKPEDIIIHGQFGYFGSSSWIVSP